jgi:antirestriction protein ArdC
MEKFNVLEEVTNQIIDLLDKVDNGDIKFWIPISGLAYNPASKHTYSNFNQLLLSLQMYYSDYSHNNWLTFKQIEKAGGSILKGEKSSMVTYTDVVYYDKEGNKVEAKAAWDLLIEKRKMDATIKYLGDIGITTKRFIKYYLVFNIQQTKGVNPDIVHSTLPDLYETESNQSIDQIIADCGAKVTYMAANTAHYNPALDKIVMPMPQQFESTDEFCKTLFHELIHWTGHKSRLNRLKAKSKKDDDYAFEELVAELGSAFICARLGMKASITSSSAYIKSWLKALGDDRTFILKAVSQAERAMKYLVKFQKVSL